jgi:hypothetical protein
MTFRGRLLLPGLLVAAACASRSAPSSYPANAASSAQAPEGKLAEVTVSLSGEPPLPGDPTGAWGGLAESTGGEGTPAAASPAGDATDPHAGHSQHGGHQHHGAH